MNSYEAKKADRIARYERRAKVAKARASTRFGAASRIADLIPMGQPILVGHHSEKRHRSDVGKITNNMRKGIEEEKRADYWQERAISAARNSAISSDDPEAVTKLREKLENLVEWQERMKEINKSFKKVKLTCCSDATAIVAQCKELNMGKGEINALLQAIRFGIGPNEVIRYPAYSLTNNGAEIRRTKERIALLEKASQDVTSEKRIKGVRVVDNVEENRLQLFFRGKPTDEVRKNLKSHGFRRTSTEGCWQRHRSQAANNAANYVLNGLSEPL